MKELPRINLAPPKMEYIPPQLPEARGPNLYGPTAIILLALIISGVLSPWALFPVALAVFWAL